ncbi:MAG: hypothetical protein ACO1RT_16180 [Planctomycetaceae bacterium]
MNAINIYHRPDAVDGVGFLIDYCARPQHSIAWPDRIGERMTPEELERRGVTFEPLVAMSFDPDLPQFVPVEVNGIPSASIPVEVVTGIAVDNATGDLSLQVETATVHATKIEDTTAEAYDYYASKVDRESAGPVIPATNETIVHAQDPGAHADDASAHAQDPQNTAANAEALPDASAKSEAEQIREYLTANPDESNSAVIEELAVRGIKITSSQVSRQRSKLKA